MKLGVTGLAVIALSVMSGFSQSITWQSPSTVTRTAALDAIPGLYSGATLVQAVGWGDPATETVVTTGGQTISYVVGANTFSAPSGTGTELFFTGTQSGSSLYNGTTGNTALNTVLESDGWAGSGTGTEPQTVQIGGLTPGTLYAVQLLAVDTRGSSSARTEQYQDNPVSGSGDDSASFSTTAATSVIGTFTANAVDEDIYLIQTTPGVTSWDTTVSAFTLYAVPEPGTCALALGGLGMLLGFRARHKA